MASVKTTFSVGLFLICGLTMVVLAVIWLGMSNYLKNGSYYAAYFDESVQGLDKDSPVKYRGVRIGRVSAISVAPDGELIEVILEIETDFNPHEAGQSIVAKLKAVGITGLMFIELEQLAGRAPDVAPPFSFEPPHGVIPTRTSEIAKLFKGIEDIIALFRSLDADAISKQITSALTSLNTAINQAELETLVADVRTAVGHVQELVRPEPYRRMVSEIQKAAGSFDAMSTNADSGVDDIRRTVAHLDGVITTSGRDVNLITAQLKDSAREITIAVQAAHGLLTHTDQQVNQLQRQLTATLDRLELATATLNRFLDQVANQPSRLVFSGPQPDKPSPPD